MECVNVDGKRLKALREYFRAQFGAEPGRLFSSPGRAEIVGNHTDHQLGRVLVSAISCDILCLVSPRNDGVADIRAEAYSPVRFSVSDLESREREKGRSVALARGVFHYFARRGYPVGGFSAVTKSEIFRGAGVSSSAAFEVLVAQILNALYCGGRVSPFELAQAAQFAENVFFGKPCGLLDQCGVAFGGLDLIDFASSPPTVERVPPLKGYKLVLTNTGGSHSSLTAHYAAIRREMGEVAGFFGKKVLRELTADEVLSSLPALRKRTSDRAILRALHFFEEDERTARAAECLKKGEEAGFLAAVRESGQSSLCLLQNCFVAGESEQPVVLALKMSERLNKKGAYRMMGGGFAGAVLSFCPEGEETAYAREMAKVFGAQNVYCTDLRSVGACELEYRT